MKFQLLRLSSAAMFVAMCGYAVAQDAPQNLQLVGANARLVQTVDTKNASQGQAITAKITSNVNVGGTEFPKGTLLVGKVEQVRPSTNDGPAYLSIVFDQAKLADGKTIPVKATLLGAYPSQDGNYYTDTGSEGALVAGLPTSIPADQKVDQEPGALGNVEMRSAVQSDASAVFTSTKRNINLKNGTELQVAIGPEGAAATQSGN